MKEQFFGAIQSITSLQPHTIRDIESCLREVHFAKHAMVVREGEFSSNMFFIVKGAARAYYFHQEKEYTDWFMFENMFMCSLLSFFGGQPSAQFIETLEDSNMLVLS